MTEPKTRTQYIHINSKHRLETAENLADLRVHLQQPIRNCHRVFVKNFTIANHLYNIRSGENTLNWAEFYLAPGDTTYSPNLQGHQQHVESRHCQNHGETHIMYRARIRVTHSIAFAPRSTSSPHAWRPVPGVPQIPGDPVNMNKCIVPRGRAVEHMRASVQRRGAPVGDVLAERRGSTEHFIHVTDLRCVPRADRLVEHCGT